MRAIRTEFVKNIVMGAKVILHTIVIPFAILFAGEHGSTFWYAVSYFVGAGIIYLIIGGEKRQLWLIVVGQLLATLSFLYLLNFIIMQIPRYVP